MIDEKILLAQFTSWYEELPFVPQNDGPSKGTLSGALVVLERLKGSYEPDIEAHTAKGGTQIQGASGAAVRRILEQFGEKRQFVSEGGRTNRGLRAQIDALLQMLRGMHLDSMSIEERNSLLTAMQRFLVSRIQDFFNRRRIAIAFDPQKSVWHMLHTLLEESRKQYKEGPVAQYLVGAKLQLRFPDTAIENLSYSTADVQTNRSGDFKLGDTIFHVTVAPMTPLFEKCVRNLNEGLRVYVLTSHRMLEAARQQADFVGDGRISVASVESFVSQNIEELCYFSSDELLTGLRGLLMLYNQRVDEIEIDKSMLIEIPLNLGSEKE